MTNDWVETEAEFKRAIELNPNLPEAHAGYALYLTAMLREEEAIREIQQAIKLNPFSPSIAADRVLVYTMLRHHGEVIEHGLKVIDTHPNFATGYKWLGMAYGHIGQFDEAIAQLSQAVELVRNPPNVLFLAEVYALSGAPSKVDEMFKELDKLSEQGFYYCPYEKALVSIALEDKDEAFELLEQAYAERAYCMPWLEAHQALDPLRDRPSLPRPDAANELGALIWVGQRVGGASGRDPESIGGTDENEDSPPEAPPTLCPTPDPWLTFLQRGQQIHGHLLGVAKKHERVVGGKKRIGDSGESGTETSLHDHD